jgi:hypothetical protein
MTRPVKMPTSLFKPGYEGDQPSHRITPVEQPVFAAGVSALERRLHGAMLTLSSLDASDGHSGAKSGWPAYVHEFEDLIGREKETAPPPRYDPKPHELSGFLGDMALLDGLMPVYHKVLFLRAVGAYYGGWSFAEIGEKYGRSDVWAKATYQAVLIQAARRCGVLSPAPKGWAVLVAAVETAGLRTFLTTAADPQAQLRDLKAKSPVRLVSAFAFWVVDHAAAQRLAKAARKHFLGQVTHGSWHLIGPTEMADLLIGEARESGLTWSIARLEVDRWAPSSDAD